MSREEGERGQSERKDESADRNHGEEVIFAGDFGGEERACDNAKSEHDQPEAGLGGRSGAGGNSFASGLNEDQEKPTAESEEPGDAKSAEAEVAGFEKEAEIFEMAPQKIGVEGFDFVSDSFRNPVKNGPGDQGEEGKESEGDRGTEPWVFGEAGGGIEEPTSGETADKNGDNGEHFHPTDGMTEPVRTDYFFKDALFGGREESGLESEAEESGNHEPEALKKNGDEHEGHDEDLEEERPMKDPFFGESICQPAAEGRDEDEGEDQETGEESG